MSLALSWHLLAASLVAAAIVTVTAQEQPGAAGGRFTSVHRVIDAAGGRSSTPRFEIVSSIGLPGNVATTPGVVIVKSGFPGQLNERPLPMNDYVDVLRGRALNILISTLIQNDFDPEDDLIGFVSVPTVSANGIPLRRVGAYVVYDASPGDALTDSFTYTVSDGMDFSEATVFVSVLKTERLTLNILLEGPDRGTVVQIYGVPRHIYQLQTTTDLAPPIQWSNLGQPVLAPAGGLVELSGSASEPGRFYRAIEP